MNKTLKIYLALLIVLLVAGVAFELSTPTPIDWSKTYNEKHKIPFGTYVLYDQLPELFPKSKIENVTVSPYEYFDELYVWEDSTYLTTGNYISIENHSVIDDISAEELLNFASQGNTIFIASPYPPQLLMDSLKADTKHNFSYKGTATFSLSNPKFEDRSITLNKGIDNIYFSELDSKNTTVLGYQTIDSIRRINFIKVKYGLGNVLLHLQPITFTNYNLLKDNNSDYTAAALSYLADDIIYFDSKSKKGRDLGDSPVRFILSQPALRWAWTLGLISLVIFMIFNAKRKQRVIKVVKPLENTTIAFTKTIGNLYFETKDHDNLIGKKINYFLEYLRNAYYLDTQLLDEKFIKTLALKSGRDHFQTKKLIDLILHLKAKQQCTEDDLLRLNNVIEDFHKK
ncbi:DUF4350 domain-containing protein [Mangrovimonas aestuarii]|uniref:DUF4350 domain-containing protein n=1 Tax=Mangrovimonas aestuarii TaxID=3018443 RepID=UPI0023797192|nr:DUF4350 domain-containing protein [Mangrovimonas aestuarii]